jgi:hypothetical protein
MPSREIVCSYLYNYLIELSNIVTFLGYSKKLVEDFDRGAIEYV